MYFFADKGRSAMPPWVQSAAFLLQLLPALVSTEKITDCYDNQI